MSARKEQILKNMGHMDKRAPLRPQAEEDSVSGEAAEQLVDQPAGPLDRREASALNNEGADALADRNVDALDIKRVGALSGQDLDALNAGVVDSPPTGFSKLLSADISGAPGGGASALDVQRTERVSAPGTQRLVTQAPAPRSGGAAVVETEHAAESTVAMVVAPAAGQVVEDRRRVGVVPRAGGGERRRLSVYLRLDVAVRLEEYAFRRRQQLSTLVEEAVVGMLDRQGRL